MPVYEYKCAWCGAKTQKLQPVNTDSSGELCEKCHKGKLYKIISIFTSSAGADVSSCGPDHSGPFT